MNPLLDQLLVAFLIVGALGYLAFRGRGGKKKGGCSSGCCSGPKLPPIEFPAKRP